jgi:hypothetical protein
MRFVLLTIVFSFFILTSALAENCAPDKYRMITDHGVICVPYAQSRPTNPPKIGKPSDITGTGGDRGGGSSGTSGLSRSAQ